ncbi:hypothetical protein PBOI14_40420 [Pseudomonas sp. Boi14]|nr:hypothetical protein PBOI14_40420 [Pseudomonas sp. Boi14]
MDQFYQSLRVPARRQHFHHFMGWVHQRSFQLTGIADPLQALARELAEEVRVLCFDELFVNDIGDAIILGRLFQVMFDQGVVLVCTSNQPPEQLYADGFNRERFVPAISAIRQHMQVVAVDGEQDHRLHPGAAEQRYWLGAEGQPSALGPVFERLSAGQPASSEPLLLGYRPLQVVKACGTVAWCSFVELCEQPFSAMDFMALCDRFQAILLSDVPNLSACQRPARIARAPRMVPSGWWPGIVSCRSCRYMTTRCGVSSPWWTSATTARCRCTWKPGCPWNSCTPRATWSSLSAAPSAACRKCSCSVLPVGPRPEGKPFRLPWIPAAA